MAPKHPRTTTAGFLALLLFAWIASDVLRGQAAAFDVAVRNAVHAWASPRLTFAMWCLTQLGSGAFLLPFGALVVWRLAAVGRRQAAVFLAGTALGSAALVQILKLVFHRPRPEAFFGIPNPETYTFPSGHAAAACCFWGVLAAILASGSRSAAFKAGLWTLAAVLGALIGFSRVYLGVHYPSDVLAGYAVGVFCVALARMVTPER